MTELPSQTVRHRRVSAELKEMREQAGKSAHEAAEAMGWHRTKVHRLERGEWKRLREPDVRGLATYYGVHQAERIEALVALAKMASAKGWWSQFADVLGPGSYVSLEAQASSLRFYSGMLIPGLLQTPSYSEAIMRAGRITSEQEISRRLEARAERQALLKRSDSPRVRAIIDQASLNKTIGSPVTMAAQLLHLAQLMSKDVSEIGVVTDDVGVHTALTGQFVILDFPGCHGDSTVFIDNAHNGIFLEELDEIADYSGVFDATWNKCLTGGSASAFLADMSEHFIDRERNRGK